MPSVPIAVSISDVLEVRGGPLRESEVWALLCQSAAAIQDFFIKGKCLAGYGTCNNQQNLMRHMSSLTAVSVLNVMSVGEYWFRNVQMG